METVLGPFEETVSCCSYSPDGSYLTLGLMDGNFQVYACASGTYEHTITVNGPPDGIEWISWSHDSSAVMFGGSGHTAFIWSPQTHTTACITTTDTSGCGKLCMYNSNSFAVVGCNDGHLNAVRYANGSVGSLTDVALSSEMVTSIDCHDNVQLAILGMHDGGLFFVELSKFQVVASFSDHSDTVESVQFCKGASSTMAMSCGSDGTVIMWDCERMIKLSVASLSDNLTRMVWVPSKLMVAVGGVNGDLYTVKNGNVVKQNRPHKSTVLDLALLPCDDNEVALISVSEDGAMVM